PKPGSHPLQTPAPRRGLPTLQFRSGVGAVGSKSSQAKASLSTRDGACFSRRRLLQQNRPKAAVSSCKQNALQRLTSTYSIRFLPSTKPAFVKPSRKQVSIEAISVGR